MKRGWVGPAVVVSLLAALLLWSYWPAAVQVWSTWQHNDDYSAGQLVPLVAAFLAWHERKALARCRWAPCWWEGMILLTGAQVARIYGLLGGRPLLEQYMLVLTVAGLVLLVAGRQVFRRVAGILLLLFLAVRLPATIHHAITSPLQRGATVGAAFLLDAFGLRVGREGNILLLNGQTPLAVAEACGGLRMLVAFLLVAAFIAYLVKRPRWHKAVLLLSSVPVAVLCNILRIFVTAVLTLRVSTAAGEAFLHDGAGLMMMPAAVLLLFAELRLLDRLIVPEPVWPQEPLTE